MITRLSTWEKRLRARYDTDLTTPRNRRRAAIYMLWFDHAILRGLWHNEHEIAPGIWRSNQPTARRLARLRARGFRTILTLRGQSDSAHYLTEAETCGRLGLPLLDVALTARQAPPRDAVLRLIAILRDAPKPLLMHCKSGADRAGFAAAVYLLTLRGATPTQARRMLSLRFLHLRHGPTGILDHILDLFAASGGSDFESWIRNSYDPEAAERSFARR